MNKELFVAVSDNLQNAKHCHCSSNRLIFESTYGIKAQKPINRLKCDNGTQSLKHLQGCRNKIDAKNGIASNLFVHLAMLYINSML